jgi:hypothetical protein
MRTLSPKDFIQQVFINEVGDLVDKHPYIAFMIMGIGIEFLGKCLENSDIDWNVTGKSAASFNKAVKSLASLKKYEPYLAKNSYYIYSSLRCGLAHAAKPKHQITLSSKNEMSHLTIWGDRLNLRCEDFYLDFKLACEEVISKTFPTSDKMNYGFLKIPNLQMNVDGNSSMAVTESITRPQNQ